MRELQMIANNIANAATTGYRQEGLLFSEFVQVGEAGASISMAHAGVRNTSMEQGTLTQTNGTFDLAIEGDGFFLLQTPDGDRLTRAGSFSPNAEGNLVSPQGHSVLDAGGAPIFVPPVNADFSVSPDGTLAADGVPLGQIGIYRPIDTSDLAREDGVAFRAEEGVEPAPDARVLQGFLEGSNVDPILQIARLVDVQRSYELGQSFLKSEDERIREAVKSLMR
jgi:flagellar basal-body rod protein FlgF